ncbi:Glycoside hydrolase [Trema orientale]|uniref:Glycoside hydrolase n=1 Tax=Trema orientale TaxID=63057 RepID=A0A2P5FGK0_TREOI|nr:Glycoside hydrolase [Trema orientale]
MWASLVKNGRVFLGLPAARTAAGSGYVPTNVLSDEILPVIKRLLLDTGGMCLALLFRLALIATIR